MVLTLLCKEQNIDLKTWGIQEWRTKRNSKDKFINDAGKKLLGICEEEGLVILNGRSKGDINGEYTFIGGNGASTIDLGPVNFAAMSSIVNFTVMEQFGSDHLPIKVGIAWSTKVE